MSFVWLVICYIIGSYLWRSQTAMKTRICIFGFVSCTCLFLTIRLIMRTFFQRGEGYMLSNTSPFIMIMAVSFLLLCNNIRFKNSAVKQFWKGLATVSFEVYILHGTKFVWEQLFVNHFVWISKLPVFLLPIAVITCAGITYMAGFLTSTFRKHLYKMLRVQKVLKKISSFLDPYLYIDAETT